MRLETVIRGNRWPNRLFLRAISVISRRPTVDVLRALHYRSGFWGSPFSDGLQDVMRGPSKWTVGERELFAAYTSYLNSCPF
jgi:hypothetical protein